MGQARSPEEHVECVRRLFGEGFRGEVVVPASRAVGRPLTRAVMSPVDSPAFDNSQMDGYALPAAALEGGEFLVGRTVAAGADPGAVYPDGLGGLTAEAERAGRGDGADRHERHDRADWYDWAGRGDRAERHERAGRGDGAEQDGRNDRDGAGDPADPASPDGSAGLVVAPIMTGAKVPAGTAAVVPVEKCDPPVFVEEGARVRVPAVEAGQFVRLRGSDLREGEELFPAGHVVNPRTVGAASLQGVGELPVRGRARVLICTGGDEIADAVARPTPTQDGPNLAAPNSHASSGAPVVIPDANGPLLEALCARHGIVVAGRVRTSDDPGEFAAKLREAVERHSPDVVVTSGGISHGKFEVVRQVLEGEPGAWFGHVAQQPGGPQGLSRFAGVPVVCLPGNPVSTAVSFRLFVAPVCGEVQEPVEVFAERALQGLAGRECFLRGRIELRGGRAVGVPVGGASSHLLVQSVGADCLLRVPAGAHIDADQIVVAYPL